MKSMLVIGLGRFGRHLTQKLVELGNEVMVIDKNEELVNELNPYVTSAQIGDCTDKEVLRSVGVSNFDICFVCISDDFQSSLVITDLLKELGANYVVSKTDREIHEKFLRKIGTDAIIHPERDMALRTAIKYSAKNVFDYMELSEAYAIFEILVPETWTGKSVSSLCVRTKYHVNILAVRKETNVFPMTDPDYVFGAEEHLLVSGMKKDIQRLLVR